MKSVHLILPVAAFLLFGADSSAEPMPSVPPSQLEAAKHAKESFERGDYSEAEKTYERILVAAPDNLYALSNLGVVRFRLKKLELATKDFERATSLAPNDAFSQRTLGIIYFQQARYDDAVKVLTRAIELDPKDATAHNYLGIVYAQQGQQDRAANELKKAHDLDPTYNDTPTK